MAMLPLAVSVGKQIEALEHEADLVPAQFGALGVAHGGQIVAVHQHFAPGSLRQAADHVEQRRLAAARRAHHRHGFAGHHLEIHAAQRRHFHLARAVELPQIFCFEYRLHALFPWTISPSAGCRIVAAIRIAA